MGRRAGENRWPPMRRSSAAPSASRLRTLAGVGSCDGGDALLPA